MKTKTGKLIPWTSTGKKKRAIVLFDAFYFLTMFLIILVDKYRDGSIDK